MGSDHLRTISRTGGVVTITIFALSWLLLRHAVNKAERSWVLVLPSLMPLLPLVSYSIFIRKTSTGAEIPEHETTEFVILLGVCAGVALTIWMATFASDRLIDSLMRQVESGRQLFSLSLFAIKPIGYICFLPSWFAWIGGFAIPLLLPQKTPASVRVIGAAQFGAATFLPMVPLVLVILNLWLITMQMIPGGNPIPPQFSAIFVDGQWTYVSFRSLCITAGIIAMNAGWCAAEALVTCGVMLAINKGHRGSTLP